MFNLMPKEDKFYSMLCRIAKIVKEAAIILNENVKYFNNKEEKAEQITGLEHRADILVKEYIGELNKAFMTPIDREDLFLIVKMLDNVIDDIDSVTYGFIMYNVTEVTDEAKSVCNMLVDITTELEGLICEIKLIDKNNSINTRITRIKEIEHEADSIYRKCITGLFKETNDILYTIKWKEIYKMLEDTIDACQKVSSIIEGVVMKHA